MPRLRDRVSQAASVFFNPVSSDLFSALTTGIDFEGRRAVMPEWYFAAPYGQPRRADIAELRELAKEPFVHMCIKTIVDDFSTTPWEIVPKDSHHYNEAHVKELEDFLDRPNKNKETISDIMRQWAYDVLTVDAGVLVKVFSEDSYETKDNADYLTENGRMKTQQREYFKKGASKDELKTTKEINVTDIQKTFRPLKELGKRTLREIYARDGSTFLADGDMAGFVHRYFQYSFKLPYRIPEVFDRDEIVYSMQSPRSYSFYGWSPVQSLEDVIRTLKEQIIYHLTVFKEKGVPDGLISVLDISKAELDRLREYWSKEVSGKHHKFGIIGREVKFTSMTVTSRDMEVVAAQQWFIKLVMAIFSVDIPMLSLRGEAPRAGTWAILRRERQKAIVPLLELFRHELNAEVLSEFGFDDVEFAFKTYDLEEDQVKRGMQREDVRAGILTINEVREHERGLDPVAWGVEPFDMGINAMRTGGLPMTQFPKSLEKGKPTLDKFKELLVKVV